MIPKKTPRKDKMKNEKLCPTSRLFLRALSRSCWLEVVAADIRLEWTLIWSWRTRSSATRATQHKEQHLHECIFCLEPRNVYCINYPSPSLLQDLILQTCTLHMAIPCSAVLLLGGSCGSCLTLRAEEEVTEEERDAPPWRWPLM